MSSSIQAIYDDEVEWGIFCHKHDLPGNWKLYGQEYNLARELVRIKGYTGRQLKLAIRHEQELADLKKRQTAEWQELEQLLAWEDKYA